MKCPNCKSTNIIKRGLRYNKGTGKIQKYGCKECKKRFIISINFRMRHRKSFIDKALKLRKGGMSYSQVAGKLKNKVSRQTINRWTRKYKCWKTKEMLINKWCKGYWNKNFGKAVWIKSHYSTYKIQI